VKLNLEQLESRCLLSAGSLETGFPITTDFAGGDDQAFDVALQRDGRIVTVGTVTNGYNTDFGLARYNANGSLDSTFGNGGRVITNAYINSNGVPGSTNVPDGANGVAIQADGKIVAVGHSWGNVAVVRYNANGSLDTTFGTQGIVVTDFGSGENATQVAVQADGKIVVAGIQAINTFASHGDFLIVRYSADGRLDTSFGDGGRVITDFGRDETLNGLALQPDGKIIVVGTSGDDIALARYNANGSLDGSFDGDGKLVLDLGAGRSDYGRDLALQSDGKIIVVGHSFAGTTQRDLVVLRLNNNGSLDNTFGVGGVALLNFANRTVRGEGVTLQANGKIVVAGIYQDDSTPELDNDFLVVRVNTNGTLDSSFGSGGLVHTDFGGRQLDEARAVAVQADGKLVVVGHRGATNNRDFALAVYQGDPTTAPSGPRTYTVNSLSDIDDGDNSNTHWSLREAINAANINPGDDTILFAPNLSGIINLTRELPHLTGNVTITGPGASRLTVRRDTGGDYRVFWIEPEVTAVLSGLTIANGNAGQNGMGGGLVTRGSNVTIRDCVFLDNTALVGGGVSNSFGTLMIERCTFTNNTARLGGGAVYNLQNTTITIQNSTFTNNRAQAGGAIGNDGFLTLTSSIVFGNRAEAILGALDDLTGRRTGGGIWTRGPGMGPGSATIRNSVIVGNTASDGGSDLSGSFISGDYNAIQSLSGATLSGQTTHNLIGVGPQEVGLQIQPTSPAATTVKRRPRHRR
jgi:uncharacterized delta-60 repeat protein/CSLREA domain-containing protein